MFILLPWVVYDRIDHKGEIECWRYRQIFVRFCSHYLSTVKLSHPYTLSGTLTHGHAILWSLQAPAAIPFLLYMPCLHHLLLWVKLTGSSRSGSLLNVLPYVDLKKWMINKASMERYITLKWWEVFQYYLHHSCIMGILGITSGYRWFISVKYSYNTIIMMSSSIE